jgi:nucleoside 2-deoxyribosyltransferase
MEQVGRLLESKKFDVLMSKRAKSGILGCLRKIDVADAVYVVDPDGYVGKSVSVDIGYAYARNKPIYALHTIEDPPVMNMISGVLSFEELVRFLLSQS